MPNVIRKKENEAKKGHDKNSKEDKSSPRLSKKELHNKYFVAKFNVKLEQLFLRDIIVIGSFK